MLRARLGNKIISAVAGMESENKMRDFDPTCRYHPVKLVQVKSDSELNYWGLVEVGNVEKPVRPESVFAGELFVCPKCGYTEFFDDEPELTVSNVAEER